MNAYLLSLASAVPPHSYTQPNVAEQYVQVRGFEGDAADKLRRIFQSSAISKRYFVANSSAVNSGPLSPLPYGVLHAFSGPAERNEVYKTEALKLSEEVASKALRDWGGDPKEITHVIYVSCTGFTAPGIEFLLIDRLGLSRSVERLGLNFMGCFGAIRGLSAARAAALEDPSHRVLLICTEICSLHFQSDSALDALVGNALFADGAAAAIVGAAPRPKEKPLFAITGKGAWAVEDSLSDMTWDPSNQGYVMRLSKNIPTRVRETINGVVARLVDQKATLAECDWAVHPGGKAILHGISFVFGLKSEEMAASFDIMREYGNMSSATVLFILERLIRTGSKPHIVCLAFGPGLSIEALLLDRQA